MAPLPANFVAIQGETVLSADNLNTMVQWTINLKTLRNFVGAVNNQLCYVLGANSPNDGSDGHYYWNMNADLADDGFNVIIPTGYITGAWIRMNPTKTTGGGGSPVIPPPPPTVFVAAGTVTAACGVSYVATGAFTLQLPVSANSGPNCVIDAFAYGGPIALNLTESTDNINGGVAGAPAVIPQGWDSEIVNDGAGRYYASMPPPDQEFPAPGPPVPMSSVGSFQVDQNDPTGNTAGSPQTVTMNTPLTLAFPDVISNIGSFWNVSFNGWQPPEGNVLLIASVGMNIVYPAAVSAGVYDEAILQIVNNIGVLSPTGENVVAETRIPLNTAAFLNQTLTRTLEVSFVDTTSSQSIYQAVLQINGPSAFTVVTIIDPAQTFFVGTLV